MAVSQTREFSNQASLLGTQQQWVSAPPAFKVSRGFNMVQSGVGSRHSQQLLLPPGSVREPGFYCYNGGLNYIPRTGRGRRSLQHPSGGKRPGPLADLLQHSTPWE